MFQWLQSVVKGNIHCNRVMDFLGFSVLHEVFLPYYKPSKPYICMVKKWSFEMKTKASLLSSFKLRIQIKYLIYTMEKLGETAVWEPVVHFINLSITYSIVLLFGDLFNLKYAADRVLGSCLEIRLTQCSVPMILFCCGLVILLKII